MKKSVLRTIALVVCLTLCSAAFMTGCAKPVAPTTPAATEAPAVTAAPAEQPEATAQPEPAKKLRILFVSPMIGHPVWLGAKEGLDAASAEFGFEGVWMGADDHSVEKTVEAFEQAVAEKPDGIVCCPFAPAAFEVVMQKAKDAGIPVSTVAVDAIKPELRTAFIGTDSKAAGLKMAETLHAIVGDDMKVGIMMSNLDAANQLIQIEAFKEYIKQFPNAEILTIQEDAGDMNKCMEVFSTMIDTYPEMNCIMGNEGGGAPGYAKILTERGLTDKITVLTMDDTEQNLAVVKSGEIYGLMAQDFFKMGYLGAQYAFDAAQGKEVPAMTDSGVTLITKENVDTYKNK